MPQGRRKDFSGKQKRIQLHNKRRRDERRPLDEDRETIRRGAASHGDDTAVLSAGAPIAGDRKAELVDSVGLFSRKNHGRTRYDLRFRQETKEELAALREAARRPVKPLSESKLEVSTANFFPEELDFPQRPAWSRGASKAVVEANEERRFGEFVTSVTKDYPDIGYFELNLETWRQLWRVLEMSDVLLLVVDCRYPAAMVPPALYRFLRRLNKDLVIILNKVDLINPGLVLAWEDHLTKDFPDAFVTFFSSCPNYNLRGALGDEEGGLKYRRLRGRIRMVAEGAQGVLDACKAATSRANASVDLDTWQSVIHQEVSKREHEVKDDESTGNPVPVSSMEQSREGESLVASQERFGDGILTIGMVGQPNAGKSSLINSLIGRRVVSVSKTPGHTKHFQTIFLTKSVKLCDSPGLVFPSTTPKPLQVLMGSFPISQVRECFSGVQYLAERLDLPKILGISKGDNGSALDDWSAFDICEAWAAKRGYLTARSNRRDLHRAANHLLRMTLEGRITLTLKPVGYEEEKFKWQNHEKVGVLQDLLKINDGVMGDPGVSAGVEDSDEESEKDDGSAEEEEGEGEGKPQVVNRFSALVLSDSD